MTEERDTEQAGAPIDETGATETEVLAAVERAIDPAEVDVAVVEVLAVSESGDGEAVTVAAAYVEPAATGEIVGTSAAPLAPRPLAIPDIDMPSAAPAPQPLVLSDIPEPAPEQIQIATDHPMAGFYVQTPLPPEVRGNRGPGVLIALVATAGFAVVYAGLIAGLIAQDFPPSTFLADGLLPIITSWGFILPVAAFFVGLSALVLIVGRAGWWAYVLGGFFVAALVWVAAIFGYVLSEEAFGLKEALSDFVGSSSIWAPAALVKIVGLSLPALGAALVAREATIWFGAWIGARGRKVTAKNREALAEYDERVAGAKAV